MLAHRYMVRDRKIASDAQSFPNNRIVTSKVSKSFKFLLSSFRIFYRFPNCYFVVYVLELHSEESFRTIHKNCQLLLPHYCYTSTHGNIYCCILAYLYKVNNFTAFPRRWLWALFIVGAHFEIDYCVYFICHGLHTQVRRP